MEIDIFVAVGCHVYNILFPNRLVPVEGMFVSGMMQRGFFAPLSSSSRCKQVGHVTQSHTTAMIKLNLIHIIL